MGEIKEIRTIGITNRGQICIPHSARNSPLFKNQERINVIVYEDKIELRPMRKINEAIMCMLASEEVLAKNWLSKEDEEAWKDL